MSPRPTTPDRKNPDGTTTITLQRACVAGHPLGDATTVELDAAYLGLPLPDVTDECGCRACSRGEDGDL